MPAPPADLPAQRAKSGPGVQTSPSGKPVDGVSAKAGRVQERPEPPQYPKKKAELPMSADNGVSSRAGKVQERSEASQYPEKKSEFPMSADNGVSSRAGKVQERPEAPQYPEKKAELPMPSDPGVSARAGKVQERPEVPQYPEKKAELPTSADTGVSARAGKVQERPEAPQYPEKKAELPMPADTGVSARAGKVQERPEVPQYPEKKSEIPMSAGHASVQPPLHRDLSALAMVPSPRPPSPPADVSPKSAKAAIVIDDLGPDLEIAKRFAALPFPVTLSVLPHQAHSRQIAEMAHLKGTEVILHLPMEALDPRQNPGQGAILLAMSSDEVRRNVWAALDTSPYFDGVNNHMGSRVTGDAEMMRAILSELKARNLFFLDSMTTAESKGWKVARELKMPTLKRDIFLDDSPSEAAVRAQIVRLVRTAKTKGTAIAIGHPREATLKSLQEAAEYFRGEGIEIVAARELKGH